MKTLALFLSLANLCFGTGSVQQTTSPVGNSDKIYVVSMYWTGDSIDGSVPATLAKLPGNVQGYRIAAVETGPSTPVPTNGYGLTLTDSLGFDLLTGQAVALSSTAAASYTGSSPFPLFGSFTMRITGNSVPGAKGKVLIYLSPMPDQIGIVPASANDISFTASGSNVPLTVQAKLQGTVDIVDFGADPTGVTNSASAIATAFTRSNLVVPRCGTYNIGSAATAVTIPAGVNFISPPCATYVYSGTGAAFLVSAGSNQIISVNVRRSTMGWPGLTDTSSAGLKITGSHQVQYAVMATNFYTGILADGSSGDITNNQFMPGTNLQDNKRGLYAVGVFTNNQLYSPQIRINGGTGCPTPGSPIAGTVYIYFDGTTRSVNNNDVYSAEIQDDECQQFVAYITGASATGNHFYSPRLESTLYNGIFTMAPTTSYNVVFAAFLSSGSCASGNEIADLSGKNSVVIPGVCDHTLTPTTVPDVVKKDTSGNILRQESAGAATRSDGINLGSSGRPCTVNNGDATGTLCGKGDAHVAGVVTGDTGVASGTTVTAATRSTGQYFTCTGATPGLTAGWGTGATSTGDICGGTITAGTGPITSLRIDFGVTAAHGWACTLVNMTTAAVVAQTNTSTVQCNFTAASISASDVFIYTAKPY